MDERSDIPLPESDEDEDEFGLDPEGVEEAPAPRAGGGLDEPSDTPRPESDEDEDEFGLDPEVVEEALAALDAGDLARLHAVLDPLHPADVADLLEQVAPQRRRELLA